MYTEFLLGQAPDLAGAVSGVKAAINENFSRHNIFIKSVSIQPIMATTIASANPEMLFQVLVCLESPEPLPALQPPQAPVKKMIPQ